MDNVKELATFLCHTHETYAFIFVDKFYVALNNIMNMLGTKRDEMTSVHLVKSYCLPSLYTCKIWSVWSDDVRNINVA